MYLGLKTSKRKADKKASPNPRKGQKVVNYDSKVLAPSSLESETIAIGSTAGSSFGFDVTTAASPEEYPKSLALSLEDSMLLSREMAMFPENDNFMRWDYKVPFSEPNFLVVSPKSLNETSPFALFVDQSANSSIDTTATNPYTAVSYPFEGNPFNDHSWIPPLDHSWIPTPDHSWIPPLDPTTPQGRRTMCQLTTSKSGHHLDQNFVNLKDRIKSIVYCFDDIKKIAPEDVAAIFQLRDWPVLSYEANLAKIMRFCVLEYLPDCETSLNPVNSNLVNFLLLKRLHRRILATNEKSGRTGPSNYEGVARFACEFRYIQGARMVCAMAEVATTENILDVIKKTSGVGKELYRHILEFLSSHSVFNFPKQISTESMAAIASAVAAKLTEEENILIGKRQNSTFENDSDFEVENPKKKKSRQVGGTTYKKSALSLVDGVFSIDGIAQKVKIDQETSDILANIDWSKTDLLNNGNHCYPVFGKKYIHQFVAAKLEDENTEHWKKLGWTVSEGGKLVIGHLDDNCYNFNKSNLMWIPKRLNGWSRKDIVYTRSGKGFLAKLRVGKYINTDTYANKEMVLHEKNILKMLYVPEWARDYMLKYGLLIPLKFSSFYADVSTLLACATDRQKAKVTNKVKKQQTKTSVEIVAYKDLTEEEKEFNDHEQKVSGVALNDDDCIVRYIGIKKTGIWWMDKDDFDIIFQDFNGELEIDHGYPKYQGQMLHLIVLGRHKRQGDHDGLVGRHYNDVKMDNRKRTLLMGTHGENEMDKKEGELPMGVRRLKSGNYQASIDFRLNLSEHLNVSLHTHKDGETASKAFQSVYKHKAKITAEIEEMNPNDRKARIKHAQSYISLI